MTETNPKPGAPNASKPSHLPTPKSHGLACRQVRVLVLAMVIAALLCMGGAAITLAGSFGYPAPEARLVHVTLKVFASDAEERIYNVITTTDGRPLKLSTGSRVPVKKTTEVEGKAQTSYQYQDVGFSTSLHVTELEDGSLRLEGELNDNCLSEASGSDIPPTVEHRSHEFRGILKAGSELEVTSFTAPTGTPYRIKIHIREL